VVLIAWINVVVSLYYYVQGVKSAFLLESGEELRGINLSAPTRILTSQSNSK
jgi:NADH:ubiquinone oxidoreductase subunit 2 (subunit N)